MIRLIEQPSSEGTSLLEQYCASGSAEVFAQIMRAYGGMVFSVCIKVTKDPADAEDASQAVFLTLAVQIKTGATIHYLGPWLKKVAKRTSLDLVRSRKRRTRRETVTAGNRPEFHSAHPGERSEQSELHEQIRGELDHLPAKYRMPLVLHYFGGMSHEAISREMKCTPATLGVRLHRARKMLGKRLTARGITLEHAALGAAIAASVHHCVTDRFVHATTHAMLTMSSGRPVGMGAMALGSHIPVNLGVVPQLVQEVAHSMARARMRYATVALAMSVTFLGGAAEAVRHLPDSIRPNLDFLSPSRAIEKLFRSPTVPRLQETPTTPPPMAVVEKDESFDEPIPRYMTPPIVPMPVPALSKPAPVLAWKYAAITPPISTHTPHLVVPIGSTPPVAPPVTVSQNTPVVSDASRHPAPVPQPLGATRQTRPSDSNAAAPSTSITEDGIEVSINDTPLPPPVPVRDPAGKHLSTYSPAPSALAATTDLEPKQKLPQMAFASSLEENIIAARGPQALALSSAPIDSLRAYNAAVSEVSDWLVLRSNDVFIRQGDGIYRWSDVDRGIQPGATNSVNFALHDVATDGVLSIERLANNTTLAPARPDGHTFVGIWSIDSLLTYAGIDLTVRYDDTLAASLGLHESVLKLWVHTQGDWIRIMDDSFERDLARHSLSGSWSDGPIDYFGVSAPEPTSIMGVFFTAAAGLLRRRRG